MDLSKLKIGDVVHAYMEEEKVMIVIKIENSGSQTYDEELKVYKTVGNIVEVLPQTHKLYESVVDKFNLTN